MYQTFSRKQLQVMTWWAHPVVSKKHDAIICDGSVRAGKTLSMSTSFLIWAMTEFDNQSFAICGKTVTSCQRNVITPLFNELNGMMPYKQVQSKNYIEVKYNGHSNRFYVFGGKDEGSAALIQGVTLAGVLLDEVALMPRSFVEQALARCSVEGSKFWFNCNPEHPFHWFYVEWIQKLQEKRALYLHFTMEDNPTLSSKIKARYQALYSGVFYDRYIRGLWVAAEGLIYPMFNKDLHVVHAVPRPYCRYYISCDYGTVNPMSMGLWGECQGKYYRVKEYYHNSRKTNVLKTDEEYYAALVVLAGTHPIEKVIVDPSAASFIQCIRSHGRFAVQPAINDVIDGIRRVSARLHNGTLLFNDGCKDSIGEFSVYVWDSKALQDKPIKENDHAMDDIRYFVMTVLDRPGGTRAGGIL